MCFRVMIPRSNVNLDLRIPIKDQESDVNSHVRTGIQSQFTYILGNLKLIHIKCCESYVDSHEGVGIQSQFPYRDGNPATFYHPLTAYYRPF